MTNTTITTTAYIYINETSSCGQQTAIKKTNLELAFAIVLPLIMLIVIIVLASLLLYRTLCKGNQRYMLAYQAIKLL